MAHHRHHQSHPPPATSYCSCNCCSTTTHCCTTPYHPPPPQDPLLQALASHLLHHHHPPPPPPPSPPQSHLYSSPYLRKPHKFHHQKHHFQHQEDDHLEHSQYSIFSSLLRRIDDLESSLHHFSTPPHSLRDVAACIIQTHFRSFLVRRSRTLRQLRDLALIKSEFHSLKSSISNGTDFDSDAFSRTAMDLLLKLDCIQGGDPMIRDGKRSISRELVRFMEFTDGVSGKRRGNPNRAMKDARLPSNKSRFLGSRCGDLSGDQRELLEKLRRRLEKIRGFSRVYDNDEENNPRKFINEKSEVSQSRNGIQSRVKKSVSFAENGNVTRVFTNSNGSNSSPDGSICSDDKGEIVENLCSEVEGMKGFSKETDSDEEAHSKRSEGERNPRRNLGNLGSEEGDNEIGGHFENQNGKLVFSAPLPVKMESRADLMKKREAVKTVTSKP